MTVDHLRDDKALIEQLHSYDRATRWQAASKIAFEGFLCKETIESGEETAIPLLIAELENNYSQYAQYVEDRIREHVEKATELAKDPTYKGPCPSLCETYFSTQRYEIASHHAEVLLALGRFGPIAASALPAILKLTWVYRGSAKAHDSFDFVVPIDEAIECALTDIGPGNLLLLKQALRWEKPACDRAAIALRTLGCSDKLDDPLKLFFPHAASELERLLHPISGKRQATLNNLRFFWAFAKHESLYGARKALNLEADRNSQITQHLKRLATLLGLDNKDCRGLFLSPKDTGADTAQLTEAGKALKAWVEIHPEIRKSIESA